MIGIYADDEVVDLRVEVQAEDFCHWYVVNGRVEQGELQWRANPVLRCDH